VLGLYVWTAFPSIPGGDSGELLAEACHLGIPHPPGICPCCKQEGYLLFTPGAVAWASNLLCCLLGAGASVLSCLSVEEWTWESPVAYNEGAAMASSLLFALGPVVWEYSTGTEVFALNNFLVAAAIYLTVRIFRRPSLRAARVGAVV
ncbi:unnamed protein product, partial [Discosporangium mesarthrocarpum]